MNLKLKAQWHRDLCVLLSMDSLVMKDLHPRKRWKSRILHQKCILITGHSWARGLLARHYMFKTTQKFQRVNQQWPYQVQWTFNSLYMACGYVNSPLQWHQHHPESPPELPGTASDSNSVVRSIGVRRKSWACFEIPGHCFPWLTGIQRHIFSKRIPIFRNWKNWEKRNEKSTSHLCVSSQLVSLSTLQGTYSSSRPKTIDPIYQTMGALWDVLLQRCGFFLLKTTQPLLGSLDTGCLPATPRANQAWDETHRIQKHRTAHGVLILGLRGKKGPPGT